MSRQLSKIVSTLFYLEGHPCHPFVDTFLCIICTCIQIHVLSFLFVIICKKNSEQISILIWLLFHTQLLTPLADSPQQWSFIGNDIITLSCYIFYFTFFFTAMTELCKILCTNWFQIFKKVSALYDINIYRPFGRFSSTIDHLFFYVWSYHRPFNCFSLGNNNFS